VSSDPGERLLRSEVDVFVLVAVRLYRDGIADALRRDPRFAVVGGAASLDDARGRLGALARPPDVALVDLGLPEGAGAARAIRAGWPTVGIVALAVREIDDEVIQWAEAGVVGLVSREATLADVLDSVAAAARDEPLTTPAVTAALLRRVAALGGERRPAGGPALTRRERQIVGLIGEGLSNKEIASKLRIELPTVKNHVHNILEKLRVARRGEAVSVARARGELDGI
jgi:two-component system, NarL family, nitrate/nitrite response regulator NarL